MTPAQTPSQPGLHGKHILLGITGGIAAYKTPELVRQLRAAGADVQVVMSRGASQFVTAVSLQAVSGAQVRDDLWDPAAEAAMGHIELARWADLVLIAPASAQCMAKLAAGLADDLLHTLCLATSAPLALAPAMNQQMWQAAATQRNRAQLQQDGVHILGPGVGDQACGETGPGRMLEPAELVAACAGMFMPQVLAGCQVLVTAGPTQEPIDPVRYISNHSSGKQGFALAAAAQAAGAQVTLVSGPVHLPTPAGVTRIDVTTAQQMHEAVQARLATTQLFIGVAAVADYRAATASATKLKKVQLTGAKTVADKAGATGLSLTLAENPDIIAAVTAHPQKPFTVGFAAETDQGLAHAQDKLQRKKLDLIVLNDVSNPAIGFNSDENAVTLLGPGLQETLPQGSKQDIAQRLIMRIAALYQASRN